MDRYAGKPFLRLLESYVLDVIDELPAPQESALKSMEPKLAATFNTQGSWQEIVRAQMNLPSTIAEQIRKFWEGYQAQAKRQGAPALPQEFAMNFVDQNFSGN